ncbi:hypothetical protein ACO2Q8_28170 [Larkinella sp. VNQ87]|uniref:hypothetical protein n=1 Tax=Larkinella sp. VNQ87 TaxID=3400921 RepID=UPI003C0358C0
MNLRFIGLTLLSCTLFSCDPLNKKYDRQKSVEVIANEIDLENRSALIRATVANQLRNVPNEHFTYRELIAQGKAMESVKK